MILDKRIDNSGAYPLQEHTTFAKLLAPLTQEEFFAEYYEKKPLFLTGRSIDDRYPDFPTLEGVEEMMWQNEEKLRRVLRVNRRGTYFPMPHRSQGKSIFRWAVDRLEDGCTLILNGTDTMSVPIARAARAIEAEFGGKVAANAFLTPPEQQGFLNHFDTHDVFILQLEGHKRWPLFDRRIDLPIDRQIYLIDQDSVGEPEHVFDLNPGDLLYVPRGMVHGPHTPEGLSLHLTMGFRPMRWVDYLSALVQVVAENDVELRRSILAPDEDEFAGQLAGILAGFAGKSENARLQKLARERAFERFNAMLRPLPGGHIANALNHQSLGPDTLVQRRSEAICHVYEKGDTVRIQFPGVGLATEEELQPGCIEAPLTAGGALRWIAKSQDPFTARDVPVRLDLDGRVELLRTLVCNGLLRLCDP